VGEPPLSLGRARAHRLRVVDLQVARELRPRGPRAAGPLSRLRSVLGGGGRRDDREPWPLGEGPGAPSSRPCAEQWARFRSWPRTWA
jgi:hypothetical protein